MANQSGAVYGLTILSPIINDPDIDVSHDVAIRQYLAVLARDRHGPFAKGKPSRTHLARLVVMDDVVFVGAPATEEHLQSSYLIFESNFDGDLDSYLESMVEEMDDVVDAIWSHCVGYPGRDKQAFVGYMKKCQVETTFFFADVNDRTVQQTLRAIDAQQELIAFIAESQGKPAEIIQRAFGQFWDNLQAAPDPLPGGMEPPREQRMVATPNTQGGRPQ